MQTPTPEALNKLTAWLQILGLKLTVTVGSETPEINHKNNTVSSVSSVEVTV